jgi:hypothetical protein
VLILLFLVILPAYVIIQAGRVGKVAGKAIVESLKDQGKTEHMTAGIAEYVTCLKCGGRREHDLRTGEIGPCDTCEEEAVRED